MIELNKQKSFTGRERKSDIKRNVKIDYVYSFMKNFDISSAIWVLYMVHKGLPLWQIGIVEGIFHLTSSIRSNSRLAWKKKCDDSRTYM